MSLSVVNVRGAGVANIFRFKFGRLHRTLFAPLERRIMKKLNKVASLFATAALASSFTGVSAQTNDNWVSGFGLPWKNAYDLCWRDGFWTPATGMQGCDGVPPPPAPMVPAPAPRAAPAPAPAPGPAPAPAPAVVAAPTSEKVTFAADAFFDFDKAVLKPEGRAKLDDLVSKMSGLNLEVIIAVGHTDSVGTDSYNQRLSIRRSEAVKSYLVSKGVEKNRVYTEGKGEKQPVADNKTAEGRAKNRRVEIEVVGTRGK
jgi:OOP family OmpA-OmpF porin